MQYTLSRNLTSTSLTLVGLLVSTCLLSMPVHAASQCKGLNSKDCAAQASCSWVNAYERKDGKQVNAFCRTKAKRTAAKPKEDKKPTAQQKS